MTDPLMTLKEAAARNGLPLGTIKAAASSGRLKVYRLPRQYTTQSFITEWVESCLVEPRVRASITKRKEAGSSATAQLSCAAALTELTQKRHSPNTSATSTGQNHQPRQQSRMSSGHTPKRSQRTARPGATSVINSANS